MTHKQKKLLIADLEESHDHATSSVYSGKQIQQV